MTRPLPHLFHDRGNKDMIEDVKVLRLAKITSVNIADMVVDIEIIDHAGAKFRVPIPMPMATPGGGIIAVPTKGAVVVVGLRAMQFPLILAYYPFNCFNPNPIPITGQVNFSQAMSALGMPEQLSEGDIYIRARADSMKCIVCNMVSLITDVEATTDPNTGLVTCPSCGAPGTEVDANNNVIAVNLQILGATFWMRADGTIFLQASNLQSDSKGDLTRLFKLSILPNGNMAMSGIKDWRTTADGSVSLKCSNLTFDVAGTLTENAAQRTYNTNGTVTENSLSRVIQAADTIALSAPTLKLSATGSGATPPNTNGLISEEYDSRSIAVHLTDNQAMGELNINVVMDQVTGTSGDRTVVIGGSDDAQVTGALTREVTGPISLQSAGILTIQGASVANPDGSLSATPGASIALGTTLTAKTTGTMLIQSTGNAQITSTGNVNVNGANVIFNSGTLGVARTTDATRLDATFDTFLASLKTFLDTFVTTYNAHTHASFAAPPVPLMTPVTSPTAPSPVTGTITGGSATVKAGN